MIKTYYYSGKVKWAKVYKPDEKYGKYSLNFYPTTPEEVKEIKATGIKNGTKEDEDGVYYVFRSDTAPVVVDKDGQAFNDLIGNGSTCKVKLAVEQFTSKKWGKVVRSALAGVQVEDLVVYEKPDTDGTFDGVKPKLPF